MTYRESVSAFGAFGSQKGTGTTGTGPDGGTPPGGTSLMEQPPPAGGTPPDGTTPPTGGTMPDGTNPASRWLFTGRPDRPEWRNPS